LRAYRALLRVYWVLLRVCRSLLRVNSAISLCTIDAAVVRRCIVGYIGPTCGCIWLFFLFGRYIGLVGGYTGLFWIYRAILRVYRAIFFDKYSPLVVY